MPKGSDADPYEVNEAIVARLNALGFNLIRMFDRPRAGEPYVKGDRSKNDVLDHFVAVCKREGIAIWKASMIKGAVSSEDVDVIDDSATADAWSEAVGDRYKLGKKGLATFWDARLQALSLANAKSVADHFNQHTRLRWGDDPVFVVWELVNEDWWFFHMMRGLHLKQPDFFQLTLREQWNAFLRDKYGNEVALRETWRGNLLPGENLESGSVAMLPLGRDLSGADQAKSLGVDVDEAVTGDIRMSDFNGPRGQDVVAFLLEIWIDTKRQQHEAVKTWGKSCHLSPTVWDTGIGWSLATQYMHQHADAVAHSTYINGTHHPDPTHHRAPWWSTLEEPPALCWGQPWLEQNKIAGKPFFVYENNIMQPAKYRGEHPMRMATLGAIQDWDIVVTHYYGFPQDPRTDEPYTQAMDYTTLGHPQGYHFQYDRVLQSALTFAGTVFRNGHLSPAPEPTTFVFGRNSLLDPNMSAYRDVADRFMPTAFRYGSRIEIDPEREDDEILGPSRRRGVYEPNPYRPTEQIRLDHQRGHLVFDAPGAAAFCGFFAEVEAPIEFGHGLTLRDVRIDNEPGIAYPVTADEKYLTFGVASTDGLPLDQTRHARLLLASTSFNDGFRMEHDALTREWFRNGRQAFPDGAGGLPVRYAVPSITLDPGPLSGMRYRVLDWHFREIDRGVVGEGVWELPPDRRRFVIELTRDVDAP
ncbi:MAG: hypothetical protein AAGD32_17315 [Planctomycetota bacterium]